MEIIRRKKKAQKEEIVYQCEFGTIAFDPYHEFLFLDWKGSLSSQDIQKGWDKFSHFIRRKFKSDRYKDVSLLKNNYFDLARSLNKKWARVSLKGSREYSMVFYPSDLTSKNAVKYLKEKYYLP